MSVIQLFPRRRNPQPPPERGAAAPLAYPAMTFEQFVEKEWARIWDVMVRTDRRDQTFNDVARSIWETL